MATTQSHTDFPTAETKSNRTACPPRQNEMNLPADEHGRDKSAVHDEVPDGGFSAWLVVLGAWCTSFCSFGWVNSMRDSTASS